MTIALNNFETIAKHFESSSCPKCHQTFTYLTTTEYCFETSLDCTACCGLCIKINEDMTDFTDNIYIRIFVDKLFFKYTYGIISSLCIYTDKGFGYPATNKITKIIFESRNELVDHLVNFNILTIEKYKKLAVLL